MGNQEQEFDLHSGRARFTWHLFYCQTWQSVRETPLSEATAGQGPQVGQEEWVMVNMFAGLPNSPHYNYHGAFYEADALAGLWKTCSFDADARAKSGRQFLRALREGRCDVAGSEYRRLLEGIVTPYRARGQPVGAADIPDDLVQSALAKRTEGTIRPSAGSSGSYQQWQPR